MLLRPLPFRGPGRLVWMTNGENYATQAEHYVDLREMNRSFSDLAGWSGEPERLTGVPVTGNLFALLGVQPLIGRSFTAEESEGKYAAPSAMLLSYNFWRRRFNSDLMVALRSSCDRVECLRGKPVR